jgi:hypothetical protein
VHLARVVAKPAVEVGRVTDGTAVLLAADVHLAHVTPELAHVPQDAAAREAGIAARALLVLGVHSGLVSI